VLFKCSYTVVFFGETLNVQFWGGTNEKLQLYKNTNHKKSLYSVSADNSV